MVAVAVWLRDEGAAAGGEEGSAESAAPPKMENRATGEAAIEQVCSLSAVVSITADVSLLGADCSAEAGRAAKARRRKAACKERGAEENGSAVGSAEVR
jgi:hypothetical protein